MKTRLLAALAVLASGYVHLHLFHLWSSGGKDPSIIGPAFLINVVASVLIAIGLVAWRYWVPPLLSVGLGVVTIVAFLISVYNGNGIDGWTEQWGGSLSGYVWAAFIAELVAIGAGGFAFWHEGAFSPRHRTAHGAPQKTAHI